MSQKGQATPPGEFWRCPSCGTPNPAAAYVTQCLGCGRTRSRSASPTARPAEQAWTPARPRAGRFLLIATWLLAAVVLLVFAQIRWASDAWWGATLLLFVPRVLFLVPLAALVVAAAYRRDYRLLALDAVLAVVIAGPLMGLSLPLGRLVAAPPAGETIRVVSYNLATGFIDDAAFLRWVQARQVDVICFQEGHESHRRTVRALEEQGWTVNTAGSLATRLIVVADLPTLPDASSDLGRYTARLDRTRIRTAEGREFVAASAHLPTLRPGFARAFRGDVGGLALHIQWWGREMARVLEQLMPLVEVPVVIGGDFNMPAEDATMAALRETYQYAFDQAGWGYGYTRPASAPWIRIDHVLATPEWYVESYQTGPNFGSDHLPIQTTLRLNTRPESNTPHAP